MKKKMKDKFKTLVVIAIIVVIGFVLFASTTILTLVYLDRVEELKLWKPLVKYFLPIILIFVTLYVAFVITKVFEDGFNKWITWDKIKEIQFKVIQIDAGIITGLFILLGFAFQSPELSSSHSIVPTIDVKSWIISITVPTTFPFVASIMLLAFFGFAPTTWANPVNKIYEKVPQWPAKMGLLLMLLGFMWIMGDLIAILLLLA
jgi:small-conductance mechanosensitive channel